MTLLGTVDSGLRSEQIKTAHMPPSLYMGGAVAVIALVLAACFELGLKLPARWGLILLYCLSIWGILHIRPIRWAPLCRLMIIAYSLPFAACWKYLLGNDVVWWPWAHVLGVLDYMTNPDIASTMVTIGLIGLCGLLSGMYLGCAFKLAPAKPAAEPPLPRWWAWGALLAVALFFSYLSAPAQTIFSTAYAGTGGVAEASNFNAAFFVSYTLIAMVFALAERQPVRARQFCMRLAVITVTLFIVIYFQLMRGDRESLGLLIALGSLYMTEKQWWGNASLRNKAFRLATTAITGAVILVAAIGVQSLRVRLDTQNEDAPVGVVEKQGVLSVEEHMFEGVQESIWGAALLTNLSMAAQHENNEAPRLWGRTYIEYVLSLPPGFITKLVGVERPVEKNRGPAWWFKGATAGGCHVVNVPFRNFGAFGAAVIMLAYGLLIGWSERRAARGWLARFWYATMLILSILWFWYSDMIVIRGAMIFALAVLMYYAARPVIAIRPAQETTKD